MSDDSRQTVATAATHLSPGNVERGTLEGNKVLTLILTLKKKNRCGLGYLHLTPTRERLDGLHVPIIR